jgi:hypothetical protein
MGYPKERKEAVLKKMLPLITRDPVAFFSIHTDNLIIDKAQQYPQLFQVLRGVIDNDRKSAGTPVLGQAPSPDAAPNL